MRIILAACCLFAALATGAIVAEEPAAAPTETAVEATAPETETVADEGLASDEAGPAEAAAEAQEERGAIAEFVTLMAKGGTTVLLLLILSVVGISYGVERLVRLRRRAIVPLGLADELRELGRKGEWTAVRQRCEGDPSTLSRVVTMLLDHRDESKREVSTMGGDIARRELKGHLQRCYPLAVVATISPLLGLFGTVYGMIGAFATVATVGSMGDPSVLADDISKALITTAVGLAVAIPALALYHYFKYKVQIFSTALEEDATEIIADWFKGERGEDPVAAEPAGAAAPEPAAATEPRPEAQHAG